MPASGARRAVDLWLCGHHWRASRAAVCAAGATVYRVDMLPPRQASHGSAVPQI